MNDMNEISNNVGYDVVVCNNDKIVLVNVMENRDMQRIVIFDKLVEYHRVARYINDLPNSSEALTFRIFADDTNINKLYPI